MARRRSGRETDVTRPPENEPWVWHQLELLASDAWRGRSISCVRLIEFLLIEHMRHGGKENGSLAAPYNQLVKFGIGRRQIASAIGEAERLGLIAVRRGGRKGTVFNEVSRYRLTFYASCHRDPGTKWPVWSASTNDWKRYVKE